MKQFFRSRRAETLVSVAILAIFVVPFFGFAGSKGDKIYVDDDASGTQNGSSKHPYKTIWQAIEEAHDGDEIIVGKGEYKERITLPKGVKLSGAGKDKTVLRGNTRKDDPVVNMKDGSKLWGVTVKDGEQGVYVREDANVEIGDSDIRDNRHEGIFLDTADRNEQGKASIINSEIRKNGWSGIYSKKRKLVVLNSEIKGNGRDGIMMEHGVRGWIDDNKILDNKYSGIVLALDGADTTIASDNSIHDNGREGIQVNAFGAAGNILIRGSRFAENNRWGIARVAKGSVPASLWSGLVVREDNRFISNGNGTVSGIVR